MTHSLFEQHKKTLDDALVAIRTRTYWSAYPEVPSGKIYGETAKDEQLAAFQARLNQPFPLEQPGTIGCVGEEVSPFGMKLGITYPQADLDELLVASHHAMAGWKKATPEVRMGVCLEILHRLNRRSFEMAYAVMHTTGQGFMMAFQAGGPHAQDRALEALAYAYHEMKLVPPSVLWEKQVSKTDFVRLNKTYRIVPRGIAVVIGCSTFPTWNSYPGLFASLVTGNAVVIKPHPGAVLPLAITVQVAREVLAEEGFNPNVVTLAVDTADKPIAAELATRPEVKIVDYTGSSSFGEWIEQNARQAVVFTEKAGVNSVIIDSIDDLRAVTANLAFTLSLYSGQMCTTSQNIYIPRTGIKVGGEHKSFDDVAHAIVDAVNWFLSEPRRAAEVLGAIQNERTLRRVDETALEEEGVILRQSAPVANEMFPEARTRSPLIIKVDSSQKKHYMREMFGPISYIIATDNTPHSMELAAESARELGAITWSLYSTDPSVIEDVEDLAAEVGVSLSTNLTGQIFVNQAAAFSDYHVSGCNPSGNAALTDSAFVARRFCIVQSRIPAPQPAESAAQPEPAGAKS